MLRITELRLPLDHAEEALGPAIVARLGVRGDDLLGYVSRLESLTDACYFLTAEKNRFRFSFQANLNKILADRRASVQTSAIQERVRSDVRLRRIVRGCAPFWWRSLFHR